MSRAKTGETHPEKADEWKRLAEQHGVLYRNIHDLEVLDSASRIKNPQFFALRVLWQVQKLFPLASELCDRETFDDAKEFLREWRSWNAYLEDIKGRAGSSSLRTVKDIGAFSSALYYQMRAYSSPRVKVLGPAVTKVMPSPGPEVSAVPTDSGIYKRTRSQKPILNSPGDPVTPTPMSRSQKEKQPFSMKEFDAVVADMEESSSDETPQGYKVARYPETPARPAEILASRDEQIVNTALLLFLDNVTIYHQDVRAEISSSPRWTSERLQLKCGKWEAWTDGFLQLGRDGSKARAILEVKPFVRKVNSLAIQRQESAQMAAWIYQSPGEHFSVPGKEGPCFRRLLVSQDACEIYMTIAEYDSAYIDYIHGKEEATSGEPSFLTMHQYGPWKTMNHEEMENLGFLILAFSLQQIRNDLT
ncbi:hypothetical protein MMC07_006411 [Pseudocyphellaria aurata]|nr:hypothetical protein [Pseudocyphellaria aurata]